MANVLADDNGAYLKSRNNMKYYHCDENNHIKIVYEENGKFYYNVRVSSKSYQKVYIDPKRVLSLHRTYEKAKSFPLKRTIFKISNPENGPASPFVAVLYQAVETISEKEKCLPHGNAKKEKSKPYYRTSKDTLTKAKNMLSGGLNSKNVYDKVNDEAGGVFYSSSHSDELRDMKQIYRQRNELQKSQSNKVTDELSLAITMQRNDPTFIKSVSIIRDSYYIFLGTDVQLNDVAKFCCDFDNILCIDTTFNLCDKWVTDCCYNNIRLETDEGKYPTFLGPTIIHFSKDDFLFSRNISEMCTHAPAIRNLKVIGTDLERAIFKGFSSQVPDLRLLLCVLHLQKSDKKKLLDLHPPNGLKSAMQILADIYGCQYGTVKEFGLADATDSSDLMERLYKLKDRWEALCPGFYKWFVQKRKPLFEANVIESARMNTNVQGLFYNNGIESQHFQEKKEQCFKKGNINDVINTIKALVERQQADEIRALYGSGPYRLSKAFERFTVDSVKWHSYEPERRRRHVEKFRAYRPGLEDQFTKPKASGRKPNEMKRTRKPNAEIVIDRISPTQEEIAQKIPKKVELEDPNSLPKAVYELHLRSMVPRKVQRCQGECNRNLIPADNEDYLLVKSYGRSYFTLHGREHSKFGPQYIHFNQDCLKQYTERKQGMHYERFPYDLIKVHKDTLPLLADETKAFLLSHKVVL